MSCVVRCKFRLLGNMCLLRVQVVCLFLHMRYLDQGEALNLATVVRHEFSVSLTA